MKIKSQVTEYHDGEHSKRKNEQIPLFRVFPLLA